MSAKTKKAARIAVAAALLAGAAWGWVNYHGVTPIQKIGLVVERCRAAVEARNTKDLAAELSDKYRDSSGLDKSGMTAMADQFFQSVDSLKVSVVKIVYENPDLGSDATEADAIVVGQITGRQKINFQPFSGIAGQGSDAFALKFTKEKGEWKVLRSKRLTAATAADMQKEAGWKK